MISTVDVETSYQKTEHGGMDPLPFNPKNILNVLYVMVMDIPIVS